MNKTGLKNYLLHECPERDLISIAGNFGPEVGYNEFSVWSDFEDIVEASSMDAGETAQAARKINLDACYFRVNGRGKIEGISQVDLVDEIKLVIDQVVDWCDTNYSQVLSEVQEFLDQNDPLDMLDSVSMRCEDLGLTKEPEIWSPAVHDYKIMLQRDGNEEIFSYHCNPENGALATKVGIIDAAFYEMDFLVGHDNDLYEIAYACGCDPNEPEEFEQIKKNCAEIVENYNKIENLFEDRDSCVLEEFLGAVKCDVYPDITWEDLENRDKSDISGMADIASGAVSEQPEMTVVEKEQER